MAVPKYNAFYREFLEELRDGQPHKRRELCQKIGAGLHLTDAELAECVPGGTKNLLYDRVGWAKTYLSKAGLIQTVRRGTYLITEEGKAVLAQSPPHIDNAFLARYPSFQEFVHPAVQTETAQPAPADASPEDALGTAFQQLNAALVDDLLSEIMAQPSGFFEWLVVHLLEKMGYGVSELEMNKRTHRVRDGGIDGVIRQDKLGFDKLYIQAKRWDVSATVGCPEIQKFYGALPTGMPHGLFITTAKFSADAKEYAENRNIVLVDGNRLAELMIEYTVGVSVETEYVIKKVDTDFFEDSLA